MNSNNNTLNNITYFNEDKDRRINKSYIYKKEVLSPFSSINNNISHKNYNSKQISNINNINNNIKSTNNRIRHNHTHTLTSINSNNIIYELSSNYGTNFDKFNNNKISNFNGNNNFLYFSNDKERNTLNNKSYGNLRLNNSKKENFTNANKIEINNNIFKIKKSISPIQEIKNKFK